MPDGLDCSKCTKIADLGFLSPTNKVVKFAAGSDKVWTTLVFHYDSIEKRDFNSIFDFEILNFILKILEFLLENIGGTLVFV